MVKLHTNVDQLTWRSGAGASVAWQGNRRLWLQSAACVVASACSGLTWGQDGAPTVAVVVHATWTEAVDLALLRRLFTGRAIEVGGTAVVPCQLGAGHPARERFLAVALRQSEAEFRAYWTVRRHVGKGTPPREFATPAALLDFVAQTPGAIGYVLMSDLSSSARTSLRL